MHRSEFQLHLIVTDLDVAKRAAGFAQVEDTVVFNHRVNVNEHEAADIRGGGHIDHISEPAVTDFPGEVAAVLGKVRFVQQQVDPLDFFYVLGPKLGGRV